MIGTVRLVASSMAASSKAASALPSLTLVADNYMEQAVARPSSMVGPSEHRGVLMHAPAHCQAVTIDERRLLWSGLGAVDVRLPGWAPSRPMADRRVEKMSRRVVCEGG